ncbi:MAG TPA: FAD-dependent oxidoreductase [Actinopolymorphaceae bacterium]
MSAAEVHDVLVVGAGPTGLTLAAALVRQGFEVTLVEQEPAPTTEWRASTFHPPTLEMLEELGVVDEMISRGLVADRYQIRDRRDGLIAEFDLGLLAGDTKYPFRLQLEQYKYSEILTERMRDHPLCTIHYGETVTSVVDAGDTVDVVARRPDGSTVTRRARYVVGADGARSTVRKSLGIDFPGLTYPMRFLIMSTTFPFEKRFPDICSVNYIWDPVEPMMLLRIPDVWRVMFSIGPDAQGEDVLDDAAVRARIRQVTSSDEDVEVKQARYYHVHQRVADRFRAGRVVLLGDAAHVNSPIGGLGLNSGIHDAMDLAVRLGAVLRGEEADGALDRYAERRRKVALEFVRRVTHRNTAMMTEQQEEARRQNRRRVEAIAADPQRAREWLLEASMIAAVRETGIGT